MRLVIDLVAAQTDAAAPAPVDTAASAAAARTCRRRSASRSRAFRTIAIDPGHGGDDEGVTSADGMKEKDLTLAIARRIKGAIEARLGLRVLLTRDDDRSVPVDERTSVANNNKADLFISLHANASLRPATSGASIYRRGVRSRGGAGVGGRRRAGADLRRRLARDRAGAVGSRADAAPRPVVGVRRSARAGAPRPRAAGAAAGRSRAAARPRVGQHAGGPRRDRAT